MSNELPYEKVPTSDPASNTDDHDDLDDTKSTIVFSPDSSFVSFKDTSTVEGQDPGNDMQDGSTAKETSADKGNDSNDEIDKGQTVTFQGISDDERYQFGELKFDFGDDKTIKPGSKRSSKTSKTSQFVKINIKDKKIESHELLKKLSDVWKWGLPPRNQPNLLISVTGGAWNFPVNSHVKEVFRTGIVEAAHSANAWVVTGGTHVGVMKYVGEAVRDYELAMDKAITTIGIATWGPLRDDQKKEIEAYLKKKKQLKNKPKDEGPVQKSVTKSKESVRETEDDEDIAILKVQAKEVKKPALDPNHSFFILVDDGSEEFGADVQVRGDLEKEMSRTWEISDPGKGITLHLDYSA